eukprot:scaffold176_cov175-Ochromonas_danica.AAC.4
MLNLETFPSSRAARTYSCRMHKTPEIPKLEITVRANYSMWNGMDSMNARGCVMGRSIRIISLFYKSSQFLTNLYWNYQKMFSGFSSFTKALESIGHIVAPLETEESPPPPQLEGEETNEQLVDGEEEEESFDSSIMKFIRQKRESTGVSLSTAISSLSSAQVSSSASSASVAAAIVEPPSPNSLVEVELTDDELPPPAPETMTILPSQPYDTPSYTNGSSNSSSSLRTRSMSSTQGSTSPVNAFNGQFLSNHELEKKVQIKYREQLEKELDVSRLKTEQLEEEVNRLQYSLSTNTSQSESYGKDMNTLVDILQNHLVHALSERFSGNTQTDSMVSLHYNVDHTILPDTIQHRLNNLVDSLLSKQAELLDNTKINELEDRLKEVLIEKTSLVERLNKRNVMLEDYATELKTAKADSARLLHETNELRSQLALQRELFTESENVNETLKARLIESEKVCLSLRKQMEEQEAKRSDYCGSEELHKMQVAVEELQSTITGYKEKEK